MTTVSRPVERAPSVSAAVHRRWLLIAGVALVFAVVLIRTAWMSDDAYITLRTVDNFVNGYGLTWNVAERVQSFTHPLWMLLLSAVYFVTREAYYSTLALSALVSVAAVVLLLRYVATPSPWSVLVGGAALILSKAFVDYSTSGLENPLTHLLLALFFIVYLRPLPAPRKLLLLSLITALIAVNRIDAVLLVSVAFLLVLFEERAFLRRHPLHALGRMALGFAPFVAWEAFSLVYYGFLVPNTAFAKLNTGIPEADLLRQGLTYLVASTRIDYFTSVCILAGTVLALLARRARITAMVLAAFLYLVYVVWIGGDFMSGRFLAAPLFCVVGALTASGMLDRPQVGRFALGAVLVLGLLQPTSPLWGDRTYPCGEGISRTTGIDDERDCYVPYTGLARQRAGQPVTPKHYWLADGLRARSDPLKVQLASGVGFFGYGIGPEAYVVDLNALGDPLLARLPVPPEKKWRIGHFERLIPAGYLETLASGENKLCDPGVAEYYDRLMIVVRAPVWDAERWRTIWKMNTGQYDGLLEGYDESRDLQADLCNAQGTAEVRFAGGPKLVGYAEDVQGTGADRKLAVTLYWQRGDEHSDYLASFVHVRPVRPDQPANPSDPYGIWAGAEHYQPGGHWSTEYWRDHVYVDQFLVPLPEEMPPGEYGLEVGWFNPEAGEQLEPVAETVKAPLGILWRSVLLPPLRVP